MSKPVKILLPEPLRSTRCVAVDWSRCCICQNSKETGNLCFPANNPIKKELKSGYHTISTILEELKELNYILPSGLPISCLNQGEGILQALIGNQAKWHKACYTKHTGTHLVRLKKKLQSKTSFADNPISSASRNTRLSVPLPPVQEELCLFCSRPNDWKESLSNVATKNLIQRIEDCAHELQDTRLLAILSAGDLVAQEAKYHKSCLTQLYNRCRKNKTHDCDTDQNVCEGMAFSELIHFVTLKLQSEETDYIFKIPDLIGMYQERLSELLGIPVENLPALHTTRFREKVLTFLPQLKEIKSGRSYVLVRKSADVCKEFDEDFEGDALAFKRFVKNVRKTILKNRAKFQGKLKKPENEVPQSLLAVVNTILYGSSTRDIGRHTKPALTICEMIMFNIKSRTPVNENIRHSSANEPSVPVYIGLQIYSQFRAKGLIDKLHALGISISYYRVMEITSTYSELVVKRCEEEKVMCPSNFKTHLFTVAAIDNVDHNPSSTTSIGSFHGTSLSLYQLETLQNTGSERTPLINYNDIEVSGNLKVPMLPDHYGLVKDYTLHNKKPSIPVGSETLINNIVSAEPLDNTWKNESYWLDHIQKKITDRDLEENNISWAAYHSSKIQNNSLCASLSALLPLFHEHAASPAMIHHGMSTVKKLTAHIHPNQVPIMCADQPLYTLGKLIQWNCPEQFGEDKFVLLFGPFHIEQNFLRVLGQFLIGSGWVDIVANSGIIEKGSAEAILKVVHVTKARAMHQVTAAVLHSLLKDTYVLFNESNEHNNMDDWLLEVTTQYPTAMFWFKVLNLEVLLLTFVRAVREGNFTLYKESLQKMMPWFFAFDHSNYARWLAVHLKDLDELAEKVPSVNEEFNNNGNFVVRKTGRPFSALGIDQAHEQYNAEIKSSGGAIGLTQDPASLRRFTIAGPEISALLKEFQSIEFKEIQKVEGHHEQTLSYQKNILNRCVALKTSFEETGNPFKEQGTELIALDTRVVAPSAAVKTLCSMEQIGNEQYNCFIKERLVDRTKSLHDPIKKNSLKIFDHKPKKTEPLDKIKTLKVDIQLYSRLFIIARERELDLEEFFKYENQSCPPSLSINGRLRSGNKADLAERLELLPESADAPPSKIYGIICDGAAMVQMCQPKNSKTFLEYYTMDLKPKIQHLVQSMNCKRVDLVWDIYLPNSLKGQEREVRGTGIRRQVTPNGVLPRNWSDFLRNDQNKSDLFRFLGGEFIKNFSDTMVVTNLNDEVSSSGACTSIACKKIPLHMEEADGRVIWHAKDMAGQGATHILVRASDTDVLVLLISYFNILRDAGLEELWMLTGTGNKRRYVAVHKIAYKIGNEMSTALRGFHAFTGCDTTSYFNTKGKKTCFKTWMSHPGVTTAFANISSPLESLSEEVMAQLEQFTCRLYDSQTENITINAVRKDLFSTKNRLVSSLPPTSAALEQHALRAAFQAGHIWGNVLNLDVTTPSPSLWGWNNIEGRWTPQWSKVTSIWPELSILDHCGCKSSCDTMRCGCRRVGLPCTLQCKTCKGQCENKTAMITEETEE